MSILKFPRLYFRGLISWDPGLGNNNSDVYDAANVQIILPTGVTFETFKQWVIENDFRNWNYYGTQNGQFVGDQTKITGGVISPEEPVITSDPVVGKPVQFLGKLVDLDPFAVWNSQLFFDGLSFGDDQAGVVAERFHRMHSRWINFRRNLGGLPIAGNAAVVWQTVFPADRFKLTNAAGSPLLDALREAAGRDDARGLMIRFCTYRTLYFQNGILNDIPQQPRNTRELHQLYGEGQLFSNPAYSLVV
ncbi:MAG TPA: hypothetical protein VD861_21950, partial [Pyrinomonadaceae bacterium]|nr:hypothetical protein [Pyrinomonadaceae bacterium]